MFHISTTGKAHPSDTALSPDLPSDVGKSSPSRVFLFLSPAGEAYLSDTMSLGLPSDIGESSPGRLERTHSSDVLGLPSEASWAFSVSLTNWGQLASRAHMTTPWAPVKATWALLVRPQTTALLLHQPVGLTRSKSHQLLLNNGMSPPDRATQTSSHQTLRSNPSHLRELNLSYNKPGDSGVNLLCSLLEDPHCRLEKLWLYDCSIEEEGCADLISALRSNSSHLRELNLRHNKPGDSGLKLRTALLNDPHCKLKKLDI
ncbi:hypothetical protein QQF64_018800 [Cirrhinus molitorella]|uniref:Uncharacterized protein n=1 Tax=Cirrhinus molitorella TaxID=172907 RepID=A0ABR3LH32_9TELE